jgi:flagellar motor switch protein FliG
MADEFIVNRRRLRKVAIIIASLGTELAAAVCARLDESTVRAIADEVAHLDAVHTEEYSAVLNEFSVACLKTERLGGVDMASELLSKTLGDGSGNEFFFADGDGLDRLRQMADMEPHMIARRLYTELPQTAAVLISQLSPNKAALVLANMPEERRGEILTRAAHLEALAPGTLQALASGLDEMFIPQNKKEATPDNTFQFLLDMITNLDRQTQQALIVDLHQRDEDLAAQIEAKLFTFEDLLRLPDRTLQVILRSVDTRLLATAIKGLPDAERGRIAQNLSERANLVLEEEIEALGPVRVADVENARGELAYYARELEDKGEIIIDYGEVSYIE